MLKLPSPVRASNIYVPLSVMSSGITQNYLLVCSRPEINTTRREVFCRCKYEPAQLIGEAACTKTGLDLKTDLSQHRD